MKPETTFTLDDIQSDIIHLAHLLDETMEKVQELDFTINGKKADRVSALLWIARDLAERVEAQFSPALNAERFKNKGGAHA